MTTKERLHQIVEQLPESEADLLLERLAEGLASQPVSIGDALSLPLSATATPEEWDRFIESWADDFGSATPVLSAESLRREHLYDERI